MIPCRPHRSIQSRRNCPRPSHDAARWKESLAGAAGKLLFFVMSYVEGETLSQRVKRQGPLPVPDATRLIQEVAWALS